MQNEGRLELAYNSEGYAEPNMTVIIGLIVGVGVATLVLIFVGVLGGQVYNQAETDIDALSGTATNESLGTTNATGYLSATTDYTPVVTSSATLRCGGTELLSGNYTVYSYGTVVLDSSDTYCNATVAYMDYNWGDSTIEASVKGAITSGFESLETVGDYLPTVVLAVIIFVVLGLVTALQFVNAPMGGMGGSGGNYGGVL
jgi:hypothetical protein